jgi:undecaprenyl diphosphate synthase
MADLAVDDAAARLAQPPEPLDALQARIKAGKLPRHVGIIMDGNGRWAELRGQQRLEGHREGSESVRAVTRQARKVDVQALTLYAFSSQNWSRPADEVAGLMQLLRDYLLKERDELMDNDIRLNAIGELDKLPRFVRDPLEALRAETRNNKHMTLTLALSYGGREELVRAARSLATAAVAGTLAPDKIDEKALSGALWTCDLPEVDLVVRTSGEQRVSNFLLYQLAYAELVFTDALWPDFRERAFLEAVGRFQSRDRRFGLTGAQLAQTPA